MKRILTAMLVLMLGTAAHAFREPWQAFDWLPPGTPEELRRQVVEFFRLDPEKMPRVEPMAGGLALVNPGGAPSAVAWTRLDDLPPGLWTLRFRTRWVGEGDPPTCSATFLTNAVVFQASREWTRHGVTASVPGPMSPGSAYFGMRGRQGRLEVVDVERVRLGFTAEATLLDADLVLDVDGTVPEGMQVELASRPLEGWARPPARVEVVPFGALSYRPPPLPPPFLVAWRLLDAEGRVLHSGGTLRVGDLPDLPRGPVRRDIRVGPDGVLRREGKPFFPLGLYTHETSAAALDAVEELGLNLALFSPTDEVDALVHEARRRGLEVILDNHVPPDDPEAAAAVVERQADLPVLAWSMVDEPDLKPPYHGVVDEIQRVVAREDSRPYFTSNHSPASFPAMGADILALDPYPLAAIPRPVSTVGVWMDEARMRGRAVWYVNQSFRLAPFWPDAPTPEEHRAMTWIALIHGARGLVYYTLHDILDPRSPDFKWELRRSPLWAAIRREAEEVRALEPWLLSPEGPRRSLQESPLEAAMWSGPGGDLLAVVNPSDRPLAAALQVEGRLRRWPAGEPAGPTEVLPAYGVALFMVEGAGAGSGERPGQP